MRDVLTTGGAPLSEAQIAYLCGESLKGLVYLHSIFTVHRDIKCSNILLTESGGVKLADFGVSDHIKEDGDDTISKSAGTPAFMAPECCEPGMRAIGLLRSQRRLRRGGAKHMLRQA